MKRQIMGLALAGTLGLAGAVAPRTASAQDADAQPRADVGPGAHDDDGCGPGRHGRGGMEGHGMMGGQHGAMREGRLGMGAGLELGPLWRLDLTDGQRAQLRKMAADYRRANWNTIGNLIDARQKLGELRSAPQADPKQVGAAFADMSKLEQALLEARVQARNQALTVLTPAQRQQLETLRREGRRGPGGGLHDHGHAL